MYALVAVAQIALVEMGSAFRYSHLLWCTQLILFHPETGNIETRLLYDYEDLWIGLVHIPPVSKFSAAVRQELLDSLVKCTLRVMGNLDLSYTYNLEITGPRERDSDGYTVSALSEGSLAAAFDTGKCLIHGCVLVPCSHV